MKFSIAHSILCSALIYAYVSALPSPAVRSDLRSRRDALPPNTTSGLDNGAAVDLAPRKTKNTDKAKQDVKDAATSAAKKAAIKAGTKAAETVVGMVAAAAVPVVGEIVQVGKMVAQVVEFIVGAIKAAVKADHEKEARFTQDIVSKAFANNGNWNYLAINEHIHQSVKMVGDKDKDWGVVEKEIHIHFGKKMKYFFYHFGEATVENDGDGGYINWAFMGNFQRLNKKTKQPDPDHGMLVQFKKH